MEALRNLFNRFIGPRRVSRRRASVMIYVVPMISGLIAFSSLGVDMARVQLVKTELRNAADAAARAAASKVANGTTAARNEAVTVGAYHTTDGQSITIQNSDVIVGKWNTNNLTLDTSSSSPDSVQVTTRRTVNLAFARAIGFSSMNVSATATARKVSTVKYGLVGLDWFNANSGFTGTYNSASGTFTTGVASNDGSIACNSTMNIGGSVSIGGTIYYNTATAPNGGINYDAKKKLDAPIPVPSNPSAGSAQTSNNNALVGMPTTNANFNVNGTVTMPAGTYCFNSLSVSGTLNCTGPVTIYVYGNFNNNGRINTYQNVPNNFKLNICVASGVNINSSYNFYAVIDAPTSPFNHNGSGSFVGSLMSKGVSMGGSGGLYYDSALGASSGGGVSLVR